MVVVRVELHSAVTHDVRLLGVALIANDARGTPTQGHYDVTLYGAGAPRTATPPVWRRGRVEGFPRRRLGAWDLVYRALAGVVGARNGPPAEPEDVAALRAEVDRLRALLAAVPEASCAG